MSAGAEAAGSRSAAGGRNPWVIAGVVSIATFMEVLDTSIANVALRHIAGGLAAGQDESTWVITSYLVANAVVLPISGWLSSVVGRKRLYMICVALFTVSSLLCGLSTSLEMLIVCRVLQGLGGGGLAPSEQSILADTFPPEKRAQAFGIYGIAVIVAPTFGPTIGGWITDNFSWHWIFLINVPMGVASLLLVQWLLVEPEVLQQERKKALAGGLKVDWIGLLLVALWLGCLEVMLDKGQREDWFDSGFIVTFALISFLSLVALIPWELSRKDPIVDIRLVLRRQFGTTCLVMMAVGAILYSSTQILPQLLQEQYGYTATWAGLALMPGGLVMFLLMPISSRLTNLVAPKYLIMAGMAVVALAMWHFTSLSPDADFSYFAWSRVFQMVGLPFLFLPITTASYADLPPEKTGQASALINVARNLGGSIGVSLSTTLLARNAQVHQSYLAGHASPSDLGYQQGLDQATAHFLAQGAGQAAAQQQAFGWIGQLVQDQATLLSYIDVFQALAILALLMVPVALLLRRGRSGAAAG
ncbi:DHA2 family efflux MFS transporter permease subunit [Inquilinus sp.]|uniref:DHA2 family efflux MFS transporter permease subunit n=1 Tax=Inquilinus sp. TaxID=1932117 RepID=UPI0031D10DAE